MKNENDFLQSLSTQLANTQLSLDLLVENLRQKGSISGSDKESLNLVAKTIQSLTKDIDQRRAENGPSGKGPNLEIDRKLTILVVDDDQVLRASAVEIFKKSGHKVFEAANGSDALDIIRNVDIDLVLTDLNMPDVDGLKFTKEIRSAKIKQPIICLMSGDPDRLKLVQSAVQAEGALNKPFNRKMVVESIVQAMSGTGRN